MSQAFAKIQMMRDEQLTRGMKALAILGFFAVLSSLSRALAVGWHRVMYFHVVAYLMVLCIVFFKNHLSYHLRAGAIISISFILALAGLISWGMLGFGLVAFYSFCLLSTILFGPKAGIGASIISITTLVIIGGCVHTGIIVYNFDVKALLTSPTLWATATFYITLSVGVIVFTLGTAQTQVEQLANTLERQNGELLKSNMLLRSEMAERVRMEEERQQFQERLREAEKMEAIGTLAGGVAHDLNNILGGIIGYPDLLLEDLPEQSPLRDTVEAIKKSGIKAAAIVSEMLTLARRKIEVNEVISLNSAILEYCASPEFETLERYHPLVKVETRLFPHLSNIHGSTFHISRVIMNLVSNAAEAIPNAGMITISTENRTVERQECRYDVIQGGKYAVLTVADTGIGMSAEDSAKIFEPFYSKKKMGRSGTGLGMAVVRGTVKDLHGYIDVSSIEGQGTIFTLYFPSTNAELIPTRVLSTRTELRGRGECIVVVDDVEEQRAMASRILRELGYSVEVFESGEEAIEYLRGASADLLILDMLMDPGIDGLETYKRVTKLHPGQKAIIVTGFAETGRIKEALQLGVGSYLQKPYLVDEIGRAVRAELDRRPE